jgi:MerR family transcriptional regulator, thiopeptide resistance regulator
VSGTFRLHERLQVSRQPPPVAVKASRDGRPDGQPIVALRVYENLAAAQRFLVDAFGFKPGVLEHDRSGRAVHAEVFAGGSVIWLHRVDPEHGLTSARVLPAQPGGLVVFVEDVDAHYRHSKEAGAVVDSPPADQPYGQREYAARDPEGNLWYFATRL